MINFKISLCHACFCLFIYLFFPLLYVVTHWSGILQKADKWSTYYLLSCIATHTGTTLETFWFCKRLCCSTTQVALVFLFLHALASVAAIVFCEHHLTQAFCLIALLSLCFLFFFLPSISADPSISVLFWASVCLCSHHLQCNRHHYSPAHVSIQGVQLHFRQAFASRQSLNLLCSQRHSNLVQTSDF